MHKTKHHFVRPAGDRNTDINVTPLVDVVLVLLIIFMVVTPLLEKALPVRTPASEKVEEVFDIPPNQIVVYINKQGDFRVNSDTVTMAEYQSKLKELFGTRPSADKVVFFVADDELNYAKLIALLDATKLAGAEVLGFATEPPDPALLPP